MHVGAITCSPVWSSRIRSSGHQTRDARAEAAEKIVDVAAEQRRSAGDRKRDKDYQHRVLGGRRAPLIGSCFRYEEPQRGRTREFGQFNVDILGEASPAADAELIAMSIDLMLG